MHERLGQANDKGGSRVSIDRASIGVRERRVGWMIVGLGLFLISI
jgi:hypothetical protein